MNRETLERILGAAPGVEGKGERYDVADGHRVTFYLGEPGGAMQLSDVVSVTLGEGYIQAATRDKSTVFVDPEAIHAVGVTEKKGGSGRAGFS